MYVKKKNTHQTFFWFVCFLNFYSKGEHLMIALPIWFEPTAKNPTKKVIFNNSARRLYLKYLLCLQQFTSDFHIAIKLVEVL